MKTILKTVCICLLSFSKLVMGSEAPTLASAPSAAAAPSGTPPQSDPRRFLDLIERFSNVSEAAGIARAESKAGQTIELLSKAPVDLAEEFGLNIADLIKKENSIRLSGIENYSGPDSIYRHPSSYPVNIKTRSARLQAAFLTEVNTENSLEIMEATFDRYHVIPLRNLRYDKLRLGSGSMPTSAAGEVSRSHYDKTTGKKIDAYPETDTVDISTAMNPTLVGDIDNGNSTFDYIQSLGKTYNEIIAESSPDLGNRQVLANIRRILNIGGTFSAGATNFQVIAIPESSRNTLLDDVFQSQTAIKIVIPDDLYAAITTPDEELALSEDVSAPLIRQVQDFFEREGFVFEATLPIAYTALHYLQFIKQFEFFGRGRLTLTRRR